MRAMLVTATKTPTVIVTTEAIANSELEPVFGKAKTPAAVVVAPRTVPPVSYIFALLYITF